MPDDEPAGATHGPAGAGSESRRLAAARAHAEQRLRRQRGTLRPLGRAVILLVAAETIDGHPSPGLHGTSIAVTVALASFALMLALAITDRFTQFGYWSQAAVIAAIGAAGWRSPGCNREARARSPVGPRSGWRSPGCPWLPASQLARA